MSILRPFSGKKGAKCILRLGAGRFLSKAQIFQLSEKSITRPWVKSALRPAPGRKMYFAPIFPENGRKIDIVRLLQKKGAKLILRP